MFKDNDFDGDEDDIRKMLTCTAVFTNIWEAKGADDIRTKPVGEVGSRRTILLTALKAEKVMKQMMIFL